MGMIYAFLSVFSNAVKGYANKSLSNDSASFKERITFTALRTGICLCFGLIYAILESGTEAFKITQAVLLFSVFSGIALALNMFSWITAVKSDAYMLVSGAGSAGFIIPVFCGLFILKEQLTFFRILSVFLMILSMYFLLKYNISLKGKIHKTEALILFLVWFSQGSNQALQKLYTHYYPKNSVSVYQFFSFLFAFIFLAVFSVNLKFGTIRKKVKRNLPNLFIIGLVTYLAMFFQSLASINIDAVILYPFINALTLCMGSILATVFFKEKMKTESIIGIILIFAALLCSRF